MQNKETQRIIAERPGRKTNWKYLVIGLLLTSGIIGSIYAQSARPAIDFNREIRPILSDKCFACHGPDATSKRIKLRLDSEEAAKADLGRGRRAIVPGDTSRSELVKRITAEDESMRMPPVTSPHRLTEAEKSLLIEWIRQGAAWQKHWAFIPPARPTLPAVKDRQWPRNEIDYFVLSRLEREGLRPAAEADRATLLRRVSLDLTGLPPTIAELDAFLDDRSPNAYEKAVDRLLASPRYGERMAFRWLDAARYADTNGYQIDGDRYAWRWRDWVISAFNRDLPYDRFVIEQLAGDLLPNASLEQIVATAFNRNHRINAEGGIVPEEYAVEYAVDRVDTTSTVFMGLTMGCARCHNHKYDPLTQKEYYRLFAYFNSIPEDGRAFDWGNSAPWIAAPTRAEAARLRQIEAKLTQTQRQLEALGASQGEWERSLAASGKEQWFPPRGLLLRLPMDEGTTPIVGQSSKSYHNPPEKKPSDKPDPPGIVEFKEGAPKFVPGPIGQGVAFDGKLYFNAGRIADFRYKSTSEDFRERFAISAWIYPENETSGAIVTKMRDAAEEKDNGLPRIGGIGLFFAHDRIHFQMVREWNYDGYRAETEQPLALRQWHHVLLQFDGFKQYDDRVRIFVDGIEQRLKVTQPTLYLYWGAPDIPLRIGGGGGAEMRFRGAIDEVRIYARALGDDEIAVLSCADPLPAIARIPAKQRTRAQSLKLRQAFLEKSAPKIWTRLAELREERQKLEDSFSTLMVMRELPAPRPAFVLKRGAYDAPGEPVTRGVPAILPPLSTSSPNDRLGLARWMVRPDHPLTARVAVNRFWQMLFGTGLVKTAEDFGSQGEAPSHPELLDWLAMEFQRSGSGKTWDIKALLKTIVMSATYRQSSIALPEGRQRDPENRLLGRGPRLRLSAEMIRDQALAVSGLLVEKIGGPSVKPYQPDGLYQDMAFSNLTGYQRDRGEGLWRRSLYTFWKRTVLSPNMQVFDASAREFCTVRETRTNTPLQSLNLMNDVTYIEAARMLAQRMLREGGATPEARLAWAFRVVISRKPSDQELTTLRRYLESRLDYFPAHEEEARKLLAVGEKRHDARRQPAELAAYTMTASLLLNLDEAITKQ